MEGLMVLVGLGLAAIVFVLPIVSFVLALRAQSRLRALEQANALLQRRLDDVEASVRLAPAPASSEPQQPAREATVARASVPASRSAAPTAAAPTPVAPTPPIAPTPPVAPTAPVAPATPPPATPAQAPPPAAARASAPVVPVAPPPPPSPPIPALSPRPRSEPLPPPSRPRPPARPPSAAPPAPPERPGGFDWEGLVGVRLFSAVAGVALVFAAVFFLRYSIDRGWLQPPVRVAIGVVTGIALLVLCERKAARRYPITANALDAAAVSILFATFFAAHALWQLLPASLTFLLLALVAAVAVLLSIRHESLLIAVLGLLGGFSTPALLSTGENRPIPLFAYLLLLNLGLAWVARARAWPVLTGLSLALTTFYQWAWVLKFLDAAQMPLAAAIFLVFPAASLGVLALARRGAREAPVDRPLSDTATLGAALPLLFTLYLAAVPAYGARFGVLFGCLLLVCAALAAISIARREFLLHLAGGLGALVTLVAWLAQSYSSEAWPAALGFVAAFFLLYLLAEPVARAFGREGDRFLARATLAAPALLVALPALVALEPAASSPLLLFGTGIALLALSALAAIRRGRGSLYFVAAFFVLIAEAAWTARYLEPGRLATALTIYAAFALAYLGVPIVARRLESPLAPRWGGGAVLIAALVMLLALAGESIAPGALFGLALLLAILNAGLFVESAAARLPTLSVVGGVASWLLLGAWWLAAAGTVELLPALAVVTGLALLMLAGHAWMLVRAAAAEPFSPGSALGLVGHLFLLTVAADASRGVPPGPLFGCLLVLALAFLAASLRLRDGAFHAAATLAGAIVLLVWVGHAPDAFWSAVGLGALAALAAFTLAAERLARAARDVAPAWPGAAVGALFALHVGAVLAGGTAAPSIALLAAAHVAALAGLLAVATRRGWRGLGLVAVASSALAIFAYGASHPAAAEWGARLALAAAVYVVFLAWPFAAGETALRAREPWLAAILASAPFFFAARAALVAGGYRGVIGALPLAQAGAMALLLRRLLAREPARGRDTGRLVLVAAAALAFMTVAIPLQLDKQWITIGWALEGAALAWLHRRIAHRGLLVACAGLLGAAFVRLALNPEVFRYAPRSDVPIVNWYLYTYLACAASLVVAGRLLRAADDRLAAGLPRTSAAAFAGAGVLLFLLLNIEIADFYAEGPTFAFRFGARLEQDLTYTIGWLVFGLGVLAVGIATRSRGARLTALALVAVTACKGFLYDLSRLGGLYRVASFVGLAVALALVSLALQKYVLTLSKEKA